MDQRVLNEATTVFDKAFRILNKELVRATNAGDIHGAKIAIPTIVILAFTLEVGLKTLLHKIEGELIRGHRLVKLFTLLPEHRQQRMLTYTCQKIGIVAQEFLPMLEQNSEVFIEWRYFFEKDVHVSFQLLATLNDALQREIRIEEANTNLNLY